MTVALNADQVKRLRHLFRNVKTATAALDAYLEHVSGRKRQLRLARANLKGKCPAA